MDKEILKFAHILDKVLTVIKIILLVGVSITAVTLIAGVVLYTIGKEEIFFETAPLHYSYGPIDFNVPMTDTTGISVVFFASVSILSVLIIFILCVNSLKKVLFSVKQKKPFSEEVCRHISRIATLSLVAFAVITVVEIIKYTYSYQALETTLSQIASIKNVGLFPPVNLLPLLFSAFLFFLSKIFRYGTSLQKEVDETL